MATDEMKDNKTPKWLLPATIAVALLAIVALVALVCLRGKPAEEPPVEKYDTQYVSKMLFKRFSS